MNTETRKEYQMAYRALRRWNKATYKGYSPRQTIDMFRNIRDCYSGIAFQSALISLMDSVAYAKFH